MKTILIVLLILSIALGWAWWAVQRWFRKVMAEEQAPLRDAVSPDPNAGVFVMVCPACDRAWTSEGKSIQGTHSTTLLIIEWGVEARVCAQCRTELAENDLTTWDPESYPQGSPYVPKKPGRWV